MWADKAASTIPVIEADKKPNEIRKNEKPIDFQNSASITNCLSLSITFKGEIMRISFPIIKLPTCHKHNQNIIAHIFIL